jgi:two-component system sensor histidine kinase ChvG
MTAHLRSRVDATESFAADVAHELKNPLASLRSAVEALGSVKDADARAQLFDLIRQDVGRIDRLIDDISAASRIEAELSRAAPEVVDVSQLVATTAQALAQAAAWRDRVRLVVDVLPPGEANVLAGQGRLEQVVVNLVDNAVSFSPDGGTVWLGVAREDDAVEILIEDEGPGVPEADREAVFDRFWSARPEGEAYGRHSGLGLSIVQAIVEAFDGKVTAEARRDGASGALFRVSLPAHQARRRLDGADALDDAA